MLLRQCLNLMRRTDWLLFLSMFFLTIYGLVAIYGIDLIRGQGDFLYFKRQLIFFVIGIIVFFGVTFIDYRFWRSYSRIFFVLAIILLLGVLLLGRNIRGTTGWFDLGIVRFQPIEAVKFFLILFLAYFFAEKQRPINTEKNLIISFLFSAILLILTLLQPDLGSALVLFLVWLVYFLIIGLTWRQVSILILLLILIFSFGWFFVLKDYQKSRIEVFIYPQTDSLGEGYNITQAVIAIGSGQFFGRGLSFGSQTQLKFLPEAQTDFVVAVISEEFGFVGFLLLLFFISLFIYRIYLLAQKSEDSFAFFLVLGIMILFSIEFIMNIAVNFGVAPVTGITLPFVSYGGSSLLASILMVGVINSIFVRS